MVVLAQPCDCMKNKTKHGAVHFTGVSCVISGEQGRERKRKREGALRREWAGWMLELGGEGSQYIRHWHKLGRDSRASFPGTNVLSDSSLLYPSPKPRPSQGGQHTLS